MGEPEPEVTYLLVDGENLDWTLGNILDRKPEPTERPRWQRLIDHLEHAWGGSVRALFFINASLHVPQSFVQALTAMNYRPILLSGDASEKVVDIGIQRTLRAIGDRKGSVVLASHDADFAADLNALGNSGHRLGVVGFPELVSQELRGIVGIELIDIETEVGAFSDILPRVRVISLEDFDPMVFL